MTARAPELLIADDWRDYRLLDSGNGGKLEQVGPYRFVRDEFVPGARVGYRRFENYVPRNEAPESEDATPSTEEDPDLDMEAIARRTLVARQDSLFLMRRRQAEAGHHAPRHARCELGRHFAEPARDRAAQRLIRHHWLRISYTRLHYPTESAARDSIPHCARCTLMTPPARLAREGHK